MASTSTRRIDLRAANRAERHRRILEAARHIVAERGHEALTMRDLAQEANVSVPTVYSLVGNREDVLVAAVEDHLARLLSSVSIGPGANSIDRVFSIVAACSRELLRLPRYSRSLLQLMLTSRDHSVGRRITGGIGEQLSGALDAARQRGELVGWVDVRQLAGLITAETTVAHLRWANHELAGRNLPATTELGACLLLLGVVSDDLMPEIQLRARRAQVVAAGGRAVSHGSEAIRGSKRPRRG